jgi:hypothetical protein
MTPFETEPPTGLPNEEDEISPLGVPPTRMTTAIPTCRASQTRARATPRGDSSQSFRQVY